jgi:hypothetical protein
MKIRHHALLCLAMTAASTSFAGEAPKSWHQKLFQNLRSHPDFETTLYKDQTLIMEREGRFYAAVAVVQSESSRLLCAYAAPFEADIGTEPGTYVLKPQYVCDLDTRLKPYTGYFAIKYPPCQAEVCANPAIGVGNLHVRPEYDFTLDRLPLRLPVKVEGRFNVPFDASLPVAGTEDFLP